MGMSTATHEQPPEQYLDIRAVSDMLGVSYNTLRRWDKDGKLRADRTPTNRRRWLLSDVRHAMGQRP